MSTEELIRQSRMFVAEVADHEPGYPECFEGRLLTQLADELDKATTQLATSVPMRFAQHLCVDAATTRCEVEDRDTQDRCAGKAVAVRWEYHFADTVCDRHALTARDRGAVVAYIARHDGTPDAGGIEAEGA